MPSNPKSASVDPELQETEEPQSPSVDTEKQGFDHEPPNGGLQAWLQVVACFIFFMNSWYVLVLYC